MMRKITIAALLAVCWSVAAFAAPVGSNDVARAIGNWRHRRGTLGTKLGEKVRDVRRVEAKGVAFHVVRFEGGGHVIAPVDTKIRPVVMFSGGDDFDANPANPAFALIVGELKAAGSTDEPAMANGAASKGVSQSPAEREWAELLDDDIAYAYKSNIDDVRVGPLVKAKWSQGDVKGGHCYNYYTPDHCVCGCVATSLSQIMHYFKWPKSDVNVPKFTSLWPNYNGEKYTSQGGSFDWANMPNEPANTWNLSETQRQAIGKLTSDVGIMHGIFYGSDGSSGVVTQSRRVLMECGLGYSNATVCHYRDARWDGTEDKFVRAMISNFDAKLPVQLSIYDGHAILGDGYGYNGGQLYFHLNLGWSGSWDYWYSVPVGEKDKIAGDYTAFNTIVYNIYTNQSPDLVIASGRVTDKITKKPVRGQRVAAFAAGNPDVEVASAVTDEKGIYALYVLPGDYIVTARRVSERSECSGSTTASPSKCYTAYTRPDEERNHYHWSGDMAVGNVINRDIEMETILYDPEAEVAVGEATVGTDFAEAVVPVTAKVVHYGQTATSAKVVVTLTPVGGGEAKTWESEAFGDFEGQGFNASFKGLEAGVAYRAEAKVVMVGTSEQAGLNNGSFAAAREFTWFDESASSFSAPKWTGVGTSVKVQDGALAISNAKDGETTFTPESKDICATRVVVKLRECGCYPVGAIPSPDGPVAIATIAGTGDRVELVVWGDGTWNKTGIEFSEESVNCDVVVDLDFRRHVVRYSVDGRSLGTYSLPSTVCTVSSVSFKGYSVLSELGGTGWDANLVRDADGTEYANFTAAKEAGATGVLSPLWLSTWNLAGGSGTVDVKDPNGLITWTGESKVLKSETQPDGSERKWYAEADPADIGAGGHAEKYVKTTVDLGLAKAITGDSVIMIGEFAVAEGSMTFKVEIDDVEVAKAAISDLVEVSGDLATWKKPEEAGAVIAFAPETHVVTVTPPAGPRRFVRIKVK